VGIGGFSAVYRARFDSPSGFRKEVALKVLDGRAEAHPELGQRLRDEARMLGMVHHPAIVDVDDLLVIDGHWTMVMELLPGASLLRVLRDGGPVPEGPACEIVARVAGALHAAWTTPGPTGAPLHLCHRDIKPGNVQLSPWGTVKLLDFGIATAEFAAREALTTNMHLGTPAYMGPERYALRSGPESDVYALGALFYELLVARRAKPTSTDEVRHDALLGRMRSRLERELDDPDPALIDLIIDMLHFDPTSRPTAREVEARCLRLRDLTPGPRLRGWAEQALSDLPPWQAPLDAEERTPLPLRVPLPAEDLPLEQDHSDLRAPLPTLVGDGGGGSTVDWLPEGSFDPQGVVDIAHVELTILSARDLPRAEAPDLILDEPDLTPTEPTAPTGLTLPPLPSSDLSWALPLLAAVWASGALFCLVVVALGTVHLVTG